MTEGAPPPVRVNGYTLRGTTVSATLKPVRWAPKMKNAQPNPDYLTDNAYRMASEAACRTVIPAMQTDLHQSGSVLATFCTLSHPLSSATTRTARTSSMPTCFSSDGKIKWQIRRAHEHTDPLYLFGYAWKQHLKYTNLDEFFHTRVGQMLTPDYLKAAFKHYRSTAHENEGGEASEKAHAGPGEKRKVPLLTRANLLPEMEYFDHDQGFTPLNLSVAKLASRHLPRVLEAALHVRVRNHAEAVACLPEHLVPHPPRSFQGGSHGLDE